MSSIDYSRALNSQQLEVVLGGDGPCLVLAGAGSGKTRTIVYRVAYLLERGVKPEQILLLTFTNKAAREMLSRVESLIGAAARGLWGGTFHSVSLRLLRGSAQFLGYHPDFLVIDEEDALRLWKACFKELAMDSSGWRRFPSPAVLQALVSYSRNARKPLAEVLKTRSFSDEPIILQLGAIAERYAQRKLEANLMDFDDLLENLVRLMTAQPMIREQLAARFHYLLVDEYQDTNAVQAELIQWLASGHRHILVVGDDAQSIYSFRAAQIKNILDFPRIFPEAKIFRLETNYRSPPEILELANEIIIKNNSQFEKKLRPTKTRASRPRLIVASSEAAEARLISETIENFRRRAGPAPEIAVLFRAARHSQRLELELSKRGLVYEYRGGLKFFERAHIKDSLAFLRIRANWTDRLAWSRLLVLVEGIGQTTARRLIEHLAAAASLEETVNQNYDDLLGSRARLGWQELRGLLFSLMENDQPGQLIRRVAESLIYQDYLQAEYLDWQERLLDLEQMAVFAEQYSMVSDFLSEIALHDDYGFGQNKIRSGQEGRIVLSTIHQAKGLEWEIVFLMGLIADNFPNHRALLEAGGLEEERRLFYVAVTRAKQELYLSYALTSGRNSMSFHQPSSFLEELDPHLYEEVGVETKEVNGHHYLPEIDDL